MMQRGSKTVNTMSTTIGGYLATRLEQIGLRHHFVVPGDYNLVLLDQTGPTLIECIIDRDDCTQELMEWGAKVAAANARPPLRG
jgi:TPP-dependent 2-oxoacid decarboxylase